MLQLLCRRIAFVDDALAMMMREEAVAVAAATAATAQRLSVSADDGNEDYDI